MISGGGLYCLRLPGPDRNLSLGLATLVGIPILVALDSRKKYALLVLPAVLTCTDRCFSDDAPSLIAFSVRRWEGEYRSRDIPGGVETTPSIGSIWTIRDDGSDLKKAVELGKDTNAPVFGPRRAVALLPVQRRGGLPDLPVAGRRLRTPARRLAREGRAILEECVRTLGRDDGAARVHRARWPAGGVAVADPDGSHPRVIAPGAGYLYMAALNPAGDTIVCSGPAADYRLQRIRLADEKPVVLTPDHPQSFVPRVTPDGTTVLFFRRDGDVYRVGLDGKDLGG